jgi:hypothetical protein
VFINRFFCEITGKQLLKFEKPQQLKLSPRFHLSIHLLHLHFPLTDSR